VINTANRTFGTIQSASFEFPSSVVAMDNRVETVYIVPTQFVTRRSWPAVDAYNNSFTISGVIAATRVAIAPSSITIPVGNYNVQTFLAAVQVALPTNWVVAWDPVDNTYIFTPPNDGVDYTIIFPNYIALQCGFPYDPSASYSLSSSNPLKSVQPVKMMIESLLLLNTTFPLAPSSDIDNITSVDGSLQDTSALLKIPLEMPPYDLLVWRAHDVDLQRKRVSNSKITRVDVTITDEFGRALQMTDDWTASFVVEYWAPTKVSTTLASMLQELSLMRKSMHFIALTQNAKYSRKDG
jgi:hypothetical protein